MIDEIHCCRPRHPADHPIRRAYRARQRYDRICSEQSVVMASRSEEGGRQTRLAPRRHDIEEDELTISSLKRELAAVMCASEMQYKRDVARDCGYGQQTSRRRLHVPKISEKSSESSDRRVVLQVPEVQLSRVGLFEINPRAQKRSHRIKSETPTVHTGNQHRGAAVRNKNSTSHAPRQQAQDPARDDASTNSQRERWQDYLRSSWRSLEEECMSYSTT